MAVAQLLAKKSTLSQKKNRRNCEKDKIQRSGFSRKEGLRKNEKLRIENGKALEADE